MVTGSVLRIAAAASAWPPSWYAVMSFSLSFMMRRATLRAGHDAVDRLVEGAVVDQLRVAARGEQRGLVEHVGQVGTGEARRLAREHLEVDALGHRLALGVHLEDLLAALEVGRVDADLAVEAARAQQRGVEDVGAVGRGDQDDVGLDVEAVHLDQQLVEGLLALVVAAADAGAAVAADGVDLVDEDDGRASSASPARTGRARGWRRHRRTSRRSRNPRSSRTARPPRRRRRGRAGSCRFREGRTAARPSGCGRRRPGTCAGSFRKSLISSSSSIGLVGAGDVGEGDLRASPWRPAWPSTCRTA